MRNVKNQNAERHQLQVSPSGDRTSSGHSGNSNKNHLCEVKKYIKLSK